MPARLGGALRRAVPPGRVRAEGRAGPAASAPRPAGRRRTGRSAAALAGRLARRATPAGRGRGPAGGGGARAPAPPPRGGGAGGGGGLAVAPAAGAGGRAGGAVLAGSRSAVTGITPGTGTRPRRPVLFLHDHSPPTRRTGRRAAARASFLHDPQPLVARRRACPAAQ